MISAVIDTNAVLLFLSERHPCRAIVQAWAEGQFCWVLSQEILLEYQEIAEPRIGAYRWRNFLLALDTVTTIHDNVRLVSPTFRFHLITADPDDNKFADCAVTAATDWIITDDRHFDALIGSGYQPQPITPEEFIRRHLLAN